MKLRNKETGETGYYLHTHRDYKTGVLKVAVLKDDVPFSEFKPYEPIYDYDSLAELNEEWEDYEEPEKIYWIDCDGEIGHRSVDSTELDTKMQLIGNWFETKEEAEKAVEKLKAWKRLKDKGFRFKGFSTDSHLVEFDFDYCLTYLDELNLLFGGEE